MAGTACALQAFMSDQIEVRETRCGGNALICHKTRRHVLVLTFHTLAFTILALALAFATAAVSFLPEAGLMPLLTYENQKFGSNVKLLEGLVHRSHLVI